MKEQKMAKYMIQASYSAEAWAAQIKKSYE